MYASKLDCLKSYSLFGLKFPSCFSHPGDSPHSHYKLRQGCLPKAQLEQGHSKCFYYWLCWVNSQTREAFFLCCVDNNIDLYKAERTCINKKSSLSQRLRIAGFKCRKKSMTKRFGVVVWTGLATERLKSESFWQCRKKTQCLIRQITFSRKQLNWFTSFFRM